MAVGLDEIARLVLHRVTGTVVTVIVHRLATVMQVMMMVVVGHLLAGRLDDGRGRHRLFLDFRPHFHHFHVSFSVHRAGHWIGRLFLGRLVLWFDVESAVEVAVDAETHWRWVVPKTRAGQLEQIVWMLMRLHSRLRQHARMSEER